ncbi:hypothetical protein AB0425_26550 [Actinosynnema sp. NPDC051121]
MTGVGVVGTVAIILVRSGQLKPLIAALATLITEPLAIVRHLVTRQSRNAQRASEWRAKRRLARLVKNDPALLDALKAVDDLMSGRGGDRSAIDTNSPPPGQPPTPSGVIDLSQHRARRRRSADKPSRGEPDRTDGPA